HGGIEHYEYPSPRLQRVCRSMVRHGADLVLCQHSHLIGTVEKYRGGEILYGQGNAIYGYRPGNHAWNTGLLVSVNLSRTGMPAEAIGAGGLKPLLTAAVSYVPIGCKPDGRVDFLEPDDADKCLKSLRARSAQLQDDEWLS